ncbi:MAG: hypothetical protein V8Q32_04940 [Anaerotignum faecicola]
MITLKTHPSCTKFEDDFARIQGCVSGIGCITTLSPLLARSHWGAYAITTIVRLTVQQLLQVELI